MPIKDNWKYRYFTITGSDADQMIQSKMVKTVDERGYRLWSCTDCDYTAKISHNLYEHIEAKHVGSYGYHCQLCDKTCPSRNAFRIHNIRYHKDK